MSKDWTKYGIEVNENLNPLNIIAEEMQETQVILRMEMLRMIVEGQFSPGLNFIDKAESPAFY